MNLSVYFRDMRHSESLRLHCADLAEEIEAEFPKIIACEVTLGQDAKQFQTHVHITGKEVDLAASSAGPELRHTLSEAFQRARRQLRKHHDKLVFEPRRRVSRV